MKKNPINIIVTIIALLIFVSIICYVTYRSKTYIDNNHTLDIYTSYPVNPITYEDNQINGLLDPTIETKVNNLLLELDNDNNCNLTFNYSNVIGITCDKKSIVINLVDGNLLNLQDIFRDNFNINELTTKEKYTWGITNTYFFIDDNKFYYGEYINNIVIFDKYKNENDIYKNEITTYEYPYENKDSNYFVLENNSTLYDITIVNNSIITFDEDEFINSIKEIVPKSEDSFNNLKINITLYEDEYFDGRIKINYRNAYSNEFNDFAVSIFNYDNEISEYTEDEIDNIYIDEEGNINKLISARETIVDFDTKLTKYREDNNIEFTYTNALIDETNKKVIIYYDETALEIDLDYFNENNIDK